MIDVNTLQEPFLSQTAITLLEKRYLLKDKEGKIIETPRDMFFRVASFLASAELQSGGTEKEVDEWTLKFYNELVNLRFLVNSPSLMNCGKEHPMLSACFEKGTAIETDGLPKNIEDITIGDMVLTHQSRYKKVTNVMSREDTIFEVKIDKLPLMYVTAEHPFLTKRGWVKLRDLKPKDDFIEIGMRRDDTRDMIITFNGQEENGKIYKTLVAKENIKKFNRKISLHENPIKNNVLINGDIAWLLGVFIADGSISQGYDIRITLGMHDVVEANRIIDIFKKEFDIEAKLITTKQPSGRKGDGWITVRVHNKFLSDWIVENFGKGFNKKVLPNWIFHLRDNLKMKFIEGVAFGDGTPINSYGIRIGLCNEVVVRQLFQLLTSIGYKPSLHKKKLIKNGKFHLWSVEYGTQHNPGMVKGNAYRLNYIKDTKKVTRVYNFEVEDDHTYVANQVIVHNCFILPVEDSIVDIYKAITDGAIITQRGGGIGYSLTKLRPENDLVGSTSGVASGPVSFAKVFNASIDALKQGGCFIGSTLIATVHGPTPIKDLKEGELVYTWDHGYQLSPCTAPFKTKIDTDVWKLTTDKGLEIIATPDHPILMRDGFHGTSKSYKKMKDLIPGMSIMPFSRYLKHNASHNLNEWFITLHDGKDTRVAEHKFVGNAIGLSGVIHHKDGNHLNNLPENLDSMTLSDHGKIRSKLNNFPFKHLSEKEKQKSVDGYKKYYPNLSEEEKTILYRKNAVGNMMSVAYTLINKRLPINETSWDTSAQIIPANRRIKKDTILKYFNTWNEFEKCLSENNHKVVSVEYSHKEDVYNVEVPGTHNYVVCNSKMTTGIVVSNTRRGAMLLSLRIDHPDILKFIDAKQVEGEIANANISVSITDKFMEAVKAGKDYDLINPHTGKVTGKLNAKTVFNRIITAAHKNGEPGVIFIDEVNRKNSVPQQGEIYSSNPCVTGDTEILTDKGYVRIDSVIGQKVNVWNGEEWSVVTPEITGKDQKILRVEFSNGDHVDCTQYHKFCIEKNINPRQSKVERIEAKNLEIGMKLERFHYPVIEGTKTMLPKEAYTRGVFSGDGYNTQKARSFITLYDEKTKLLPHIMCKSYFGKKDTKVYVILDNENGIWDKTFVPSPEYTIQTRLDWLAGILDTDAGSTGAGSYSIWSIDEKFLMKVKSMIHTLGIGGTLSLGKTACIKMMPDGKGGEKEYPTQDCWRLTISGSSIVELAKIGLKTHRVDISHDVKRSAKRLIQIKSVTEIGIAKKVYCFNEPKRHKGMFGGVAIGQCGEMMAIPYSICNLGSINLAKFAKDGEILWDELKETVKIATRMLDNTISVNEFPIPQIKEVGERNRYIGLGVMGFADMLIQLGIPYDSEGGLMTAEMVMKTIYDTSFETSKELGKEKGNAPGIEQSIFAKEKYLRNLMHTVVAPTGSIGMVADTSAGIEPNFGMVYTKTVMNGTSFVTVNKYLEEALKKEGIYSKELIQKIAAAKSLKELKEIPKSIKDVFVTTMDVSPEYHVKMQAAIQKYTSSGVSKTVNAPSSSTIDDVYKTYMLSWELKCKGITYYRDGSRTLQVLTSGTPEIKKVEEPKKEIVRTRKRPAITRGETHKISIGCGDMYVTVNEDEKGLCEVFISVGKSGGCVASQCEAIGRMISLSVRSSVQLSKVIDQLKGIRCPSPTLNSGGSVLSCADAIGKVLEIYMKNKKKEEVLEKRSTADMGHNPSCSECGAMLVFSEGCVKCLSCGFSKCS